MATAAKRATTCSELAVTSPELGEAGCKRLPRHGGEHRPFLTLAQVRRAERKPKAERSPKSGRKATVSAIRKAVKAAKQQAGVNLRGRLTAANRRLVIDVITEGVANGTISTSVALGAVASL